MNVNELLKEARQKALKPTATVVRYSNGQIRVDNEGLLSAMERERRVSASEEAGKLRQEPANIQASVSANHNAENSAICASSRTTTHRPKDEKTRQLVALGLAMGGPRFPNFDLRASQRDDDVETFEPFLREYLRVEGHTVNDTASLTILAKISVYRSGRYSWWRQVFGSMPPVV
jgi:hypothetical protein